MRPEAGADGLVTSAAGTGSLPFRGRAWSEASAFSGPQSLDFADAGLERPIFRFDRGGEAGVRRRVLVAAIDLRFVGQRHEFLQAGPHAFRVALEDAAASERKQRVAGEGQTVVGKMKDDVPERVARGLEDAHVVAGERQRRLFADAAIESADAFAFRTPGPSPYRRIFP